MVCLHIISLSSFNQSKRSSYSIFQPSFQPYISLYPPAMFLIWAIILFIFFNSWIIVLSFSLILPVSLRGLFPSKPFCKCSEDNIFFLKFKSDYSITYFNFVIVSQYALVGSALQASLWPYVSPLPFRTLPSSQSCHVLLIRAGDGSVRPLDPS